MNQEAIPVKYVLYSHYADREQDDFRDWKNGKIPVRDLEGMTFLRAHLKAVRDLLTSPGHEG